MIGQAQDLKLVQLCPPASLITPELVNGLHQKGFVVRAWRVGDTELMRQVVDAGADGMTVNFPDKLDEYLKAE